MNLGSMLLAELSGKVSQNIQHETSSKIAEPVKELITVKREEITCENNSICRKETPLPFVVQPQLITKKDADLPIKKSSAEINRPIKRVSAITNILFNNTGNAALF